MPRSRDLPVVFRPLPGEVLSSWIVRIAGVYHLDAPALIEHLGWPIGALTEIDLSPPERIVREFSELTRVSQNTVQRHTLLGANPAWLPDWVTLQPVACSTTDKKPAFRSGVLFNVCPACLRTDLNSHGQFIRISWLCAATTICDKHFFPLRECRDFLDPPFECRHGSTGARFFHCATKSVLDSPFRDHKTSGMSVALSEFEQMVKLSLTATDRLSDTSSEATAAEELISVLEDLTWALLQIIDLDGTRVIHCFQTESFPVPRGWRNLCPVETLSRADVNLRRSILAVAACLLLPNRFRELARTAPYLNSPSRYSELLRSLGRTRSDLLLARRFRWPSSFRKEMERAA